MKNITFLFLALAWSIASCKPDPAPKPDDREPPKQYSYWVVNEDSFRTSDVKTALGLGRCDLYSDGVNSFGFTFFTGEGKLPKHGYFPLAHDNGENPNYVYTGFNYKDNLFIVASNESSSIQPSSINNKARYTLPPTWFVNYYNHNDSVLIHGVFNEP